MLDLRDSSTYQWILDQGRIEGRADGQLREARRILLRMGCIRFGAATDAIEAAVEAITDLPRLEDLSERVLTAATWQELLAVP